MKSPKCPPCHHDCRQGRDCPAPAPWPFPPRGGPVAATPSEMRQWETRQRKAERERLLQERDAMPEAPW